MHVVRQVPLTHAAVAPQLGCAFHTVQPVGAFWQTVGAPASHFAAPLVHSSAQGGMHAPPWHVSPAAHAVEAAHVGHPVAVAWQTSMPPEAAQRFAPTEQLTAHAAQLPPLHEVPAPQLLPAFHTVQLFTSFAQVSVPLQ